MSDKGDEKWIDFLDQQCPRSAEDRKTMNDGETNDTSPDLKFDGLSIELNGANLEVHTDS